MLDVSLDLSKSQYCVFKSKVNIKLFSILIKGAVELKKCYYFNSIVQNICHGSSLWDNNLTYFQPVILVIDKYNHFIYIQKMVSEFRTQK